MTALLVVLGAVVGAPLRYLVDLYVGTRHATVFPWGTLTVNATGSLVLGAVAGAAAAGAPAWVLPLVGTGFCGALTTFSTLSWETLRLLEEGAVVEAVLNLGVSLLVGLVACAGGWVLAASLLGAV